MRDMGRFSSGWPDAEWRDIAGALTLLTRLPLPVDHTRVGRRAAALAWAFPLAGAIVGLIAGAFGRLLWGMGVPDGMAAAGALGALVLLTGGLHEDGLSDCADGFAGGQTARRRLEIMKDSRVGAFGAVALGVVLLARWSGLEALFDGPFVAALGAVGAASRLPIVLTMYAMPLARDTGLAAGLGHVGAGTAALASATALLLALLLAGWAGGAMLILAVLAGVPVCYIAWRRIAGITGDVLGCVQQMAEVAALATLAALLV